MAKQSISTTKLPPLVAPGQPMRASWGNAVVETLDTLTRGINPPQQVRRRPQPSGASAIEVMKLVRVEDDYLVCKRDDGSEVKAVKPRKLQRTPWDQKPANSLGLTYVYLNNTTRRVSKSGTPFVGQEEVRPIYEVDGLHALQQITSEQAAALGVADATHLDLNVDGRAWAIRGFAS